MDRKALIVTCAAAALTILLPGGHAAADELVVWIKAFIPNKHESNPSYVRPQPNNPGKWMIPAPMESDYCFGTDNRMFSSARNASARMTSTMKLTFTTGPGGSLASLPSHETNLTHKLWCRDGADREAPRPAGTGQMYFGNPVQADGVIQFSVEGRANNPFVFGSPSIYYTGNFYYTKATKTLKFVGTIGKFPAFEAYAQLNNGQPVTIFRVPPSTGSTVWDLINFGGLGTRSSGGEIRL